MSSSRNTVRTAQRGTTESAWVRRTFIALALGFSLLADGLGEWLGVRSLDRSTSARSSPSRTSRCRS